MFAVPGWSLAAAAPKQQTVPLSASDGPSQSSRNSKKRRRGQGKAQGPPVTAENLAEYWNKYIDGSTPKSASENLPVKRQKRAKDHKSPPKERTVDDQAVVTATSESATSNGPNKEKVRSQDGVLAPSKKTTSEPPTTAAPAPTATSTTLTPLQASMRQKLIAARFRHLNQTLYTTDSSNAMKTFSDNPEFFQEYHEGFRKQVSVWPENPVDGYFEQLKARARIRRHRKPHRGGRKEDDQPTGEDLQPLPRVDGICTVADLGCGDAALAQKLHKISRKLKIKVLSYDLQSPNSYVTQADISRLPLKDGSVDVAIFCLALMGTNWIDFLEEAWRVLRWKGELWIAEIKSRFGRVQKSRVDHSVGNKRKTKQGRKNDDDNPPDVELMGSLEEEDSSNRETDVSKFVEVLRRRGFAVRNSGGIDMSNKMFVRMSFTKALQPVKGKAASSGSTAGRGSGSVGFGKGKPKFIEQSDADDVDELAVLKPCVYKTR